MTNPLELLEAASTVALVDWRTADIPRTLVEAGFSVTSLHHVNNTATSCSAYAMQGDIPAGIDSHNIFPAMEDQTGYLVCQPLPEMPSCPDIVNVSRPSEEVPGIAYFAVKLGAKSLWLQPGSESAEGQRIAEQAGLDFIQGVCIAKTARILPTRNPG